MVGVIIKYEVRISSQCGQLLWSSCKFSSSYFVGFFSRMRVVENCDTPYVNCSTERCACSKVYVTCMPWASALGTFHRCDSSAPSVIRVGNGCIRQVSCFHISSLSHCPPCAFPSVLSVGWSAMKVWLPCTQVRSWPSSSSLSTRHYVLLWLAQSNSSLSVEVHLKMDYGQGFCLLGR